MGRLILGFLIMGVMAFSSISLAQESSCNAFGKKCHVDGINTIHTNDDGPNANLLITIKNAINWCLRILATIVLCICLYGGFLMLTSGADSKGYENGRKVLKNALLGLTIILLAWMIVSVVFWFVSVLSSGNQTQPDTIQPLQN